MIGTSVLFKLLVLLTLIQKGTGEILKVYLQPGNRTERFYQKGDTLSFTIDLSSFTTAKDDTGLEVATFKTADNAVIRNHSTHWDSQCAVDIDLKTHMSLVIENLGPEADGRKIKAELQLKGGASSAADIDASVELKMDHEEQDDVHGPSTTDCTTAAVSVAGSVHVSLLVVLLLLLTPLAV